MKKIICTLIAFVVAFCSLSVVALAASDKIAPAGWFDYEIEVEDDVGKVVYITELKEDVEGKLIIPKEIKGKKVIGIDDEAFLGCDEITEILVSPYVCFIGKEAFAECTSLEKITIPNGLLGIDDEAFRNCSSLEVIDFYDSGSIFNDSPWLTGEDIFKGCTSLKEIHFPLAVSTIPGGMFDGCINLEMVEFPYGVGQIQRGAFSDCEKLKEIYFHTTVAASFNESAVSKDVIIYGEEHYLDHWDELVEDGYTVRGYDTKYVPVPEIYTKTPVGTYIIVIVVIVAVLVGAVVVLKKTGKDKAIKTFVLRLVSKVTKKGGIK